MAARSLSSFTARRHPATELSRRSNQDDVDYWTDVKPVIEQRCVVCHACYDADCQLKMSSIEGIERGASPAIVYNKSRLKMGELTRLFEDAQSVPEWRTMGFHPVLNEHGDSALRPIAKPASCTRS